MNISCRNRFRYNGERAVQHLLMLTCITPPPGSKFRSGRVSEPVEELGVGDVARLEEDRVPALVGVVLPAHLPVRPLEGGGVAALLDLS